ANTIERGSQVDARAKRVFQVAETQWHDENTGENPQPVLLRRINARLLFDEDDQSDLEVLPLLRIAHATGEDVGLPRQDPTFVPPCFVLNGSPVLRDLMRNLAHQVEATRGELVNQINRGGAFSWENVRGIQFEQVLRLGVLNRFAGRLRHLVQAPSVSPFEVYLELRELLGGLAALHPDNDQFEAADYDHDSPGVVFHELSAKIRRLLRGTVAAPIMRVPFRREGNILLAELTDEHLTRPNEYFLGIKTKQDPSQLAKLVENPDEFKLMARTLAGRAIFGVRLAEERYPPFGLPAETGLHYFRLQRAESERMWDRIAQEKAMAIRYPGMDTSDYDITVYMTVPEGGGSAEKAE
ncbi:MAG: type VI secretion system baseplate subunit TssK, partial [Planctomycetota bacterium]